jgi:hypothetical protein
VGLRAGLDTESYRCNKNNSSRDEIYENNSRIHLGRSQNKEKAKELKVTPVLDKIQDYKRNWVQYVNRMLRNRLPRLIKLHPKRDMEPRKTIKRLLDA